MHSKDIHKQLVEQATALTKYIWELALRAISEGASLRNENSQKQDSITTNHFVLSMLSCVESQAVLGECQRRKGSRTAPLYK